MILSLVALLLLVGVHHVKEALIFCRSIGLYRILVTDDYVTYIPLGNISFQPSFSILDLNLVYQDTPQGHKSRLQCGAVGSPGGRVLEWMLQGKIYV
jgi:hypothetical protein